MTKADEATGAKPGKGNGERVVIQKYANRRLYNKATSTYITLDNLAEMVREGEAYGVDGAGVERGLASDGANAVSAEELAFVWCGHRIDSCFKLDSSSILLCGSGLWRAARTQHGW